MSAQTSLFDSPVTAGTHRKADRWTSVAAAKAKDPGPDQAAILAALIDNGGKGTVDTAQAALPHRDRGCVSRRLTDLEQGGFIIATDTAVMGSRGRMVTVWQVIR